jgi:hypothetical protein
MSVGLEISSVAGNTTYSSTDVTWNQVDFFQVSANASVTRDYPVLNGRTARVVQMFIDPPPTDRKAIAHTVSLGITFSGNRRVTVLGGNENVFILVLMR